MKCIFSCSILLMGCFGLILSCKKEKDVTTYKAAFTKTFFISQGDTLYYQYLSPEIIEPGKKYPLLLFFHSAGDRGTNFDLQSLNVPEALTNAASRRNYPCYIIIPQCPTDQQWVDVNWHDENETMPTKISPIENRCVQLLDSLQNNLNAVDTSRLYISGYSMGGFAVWDLISRMPGKFAAAAPVCGGGDELQAANLIHLPIWAFHGNLDNEVMPSRSINMVTAINNRGGMAKLKLYEQVGHDSWNYAYKGLELVDWMFAQHQ